MISSPHSPEISAESSDGGDLARQRDFAFAFAVLSLTIALVLLASNARDHSAETGGLEGEIRAHEKLLSDGTQFLHLNEEILRQNQADLEKVRKAVGQK